MKFVKIDFFSVDMKKYKLQNNVCCFIKFFLMNYVNVVIMIDVDYDGQFLGYLQKYFIIKRLLDQVLFIFFCLDFLVIGQNCLSKDEFVLLKFL